MASPPDVDFIARALVKAMSPRQCWAAMHMFDRGLQASGLLLHPVERLSLQSEVQAVVFGTPSCRHLSGNKRKQPHGSRVNAPIARVQQRMKTSAAGQPHPPTTGRLSRSLLEAARRGDVTKVSHLLSAGVDPNACRTSSGETALALASAAGNVAVVRLLLSAQADCYAYDDAGVSPLMRAAREGHHQVITVLLLEGEADAFAVSTDGRFALLDVAAAGAEAAARALMQHGGADPNACVEACGEHALLAAARRGHLKLVKLLVQAGAKVNRADKAGRTALLEAARNGDAGMVLYLMSNGAKCIPDFLQRRTPLMEAASAGFLDCTQALLTKRGVANVKAEDASGQTALQLARTPGVRAVLTAALDATAEAAS